MTREQAVAEHNALTPARREALIARYEAARHMEKAAQCLRENERYGRSTGVVDMHRVRAADDAYEVATAACWRTAS